MRLLSLRSEPFHNVLVMISKTSLLTAILAALSPQKGIAMESTTKGERVSIQVGDVRLSVLRAYLGNETFKAGRYSVLTFVASSPEVLPISANDTAKVLIGLTASAVVVDNETGWSNLLKAGVRFAPAESGPGGLTRYPSLTKLSGSTSGIQIDAYTGELSHERVHYSCMINAIEPALSFCDYYGSRLGLSLTYKFPPEHLVHWREIHGGVVKLIDSFVVRQ